jgi:hypothetical protein
MLILPMDMEDLLIPTQFILYTGNGSLSETYNHCMDAYDKNITSKELLKELKDAINECERL